MTKGRFTVLYAVFLASISLSVFLTAGCSKQAETTEAPVSPPSEGAKAGPTGGPGGLGNLGGMPGGGQRGGPGKLVAENASGAEIYQAKCGCHGAEGKGGRAPILTISSTHSDEDLYKTIHDGHDKMPAFGIQLTEAQIKKVVTHIKQFKS